MRHEVQPATAHTIRNLIILVAILVAATGLTIWMTQGVQTLDRSGGPTSALRSPSGEISPAEDWNSLELDTGSTNELDDRWAWGSTAAVPGPPAKAPGVDTWPPDRAENQMVPGPSASFAAPPSKWPRFSSDGVMPASPPRTPSIQSEQTPVANLIHIEPAPLRR